MINGELSFLGDFTAALTLIFVSLENVGFDFWGYGDSWGFVHFFISRRGAESQRREDEVIQHFYYFLISENQSHYSAIILALNKIFMRYIIENLTFSTLCD